MTWIEKHMMRSTMIACRRRLQGRRKSLQSGGGPRRVSVEGRGNVAKKFTPNDWKYMDCHQRSGTNYVKTCLPKAGSAYAWQLSRTPRISPKINTCLFCALCRTREGLPGRSPITPSQARLTLEFFLMVFRKRSCNLLVWVSLSILLNLWPGCHIHPP
jgi:hypothetical protein